MRLIQSMANNQQFEFLELETNLTVSDAIGGASIKALKKAILPINVVKSIAFLINRFNDSFNAKGKLNSDQVATLAVDLVDVFGYESLEDVVLMFKYARQGKIGDGKDFKLDSQTVFHKFVPQYLELKAIEREKLHEKRKAGDEDEKWDKVGLDELKKNIDANLPKRKESVKMGLGARLKKTLDVPSTNPVLRDRVSFVNNMKVEAKGMSEEQLKTYLLKNDVDSENYDQGVYEIVEQEMDRRLKYNKLK